jgi:hypothetical protein
MMGGNLKDQAGSGDISLLLKDRVTQLKEVVAHWTKYQTFMEGLVQRLECLIFGPMCHHISDIHGGPRPTP